MFNYDPNTDGPEAKDLFDKMYKNVVFDKKLYKKLHTFRLNWINKGVEYAEFLGGNSLGVYPIRFSTRDDSYLLTDIYNVDPAVVRTNIIKLPDISSTWAVSTNPVLQTLCYTMHRFIIDGKMGNKLEAVLRECYYIFAYKVFGSLLSHYFKYNTTPAIAKAIYEKLSNRYLIKRLGTWDKVLEHRAGAVFPKTGLHKDRILTYSTNDSVRIVNDLQGGIRETIKYIYIVMKDIIDNQKSIKTTSLISSNSGSEDSTRELIDRPDKYIRKLTEIMNSTPNLVDDDLIHLISNFVKASDPVVIKKTLINLSNNYDPRHKDAVYLDHLILKTIAYINTKGIATDYLGQIVEIIGYMKGYWSSGSVKDKDMLLVKKVLEKATKKATKRTTKWVIATNSLATIIYLFVRSVK